MNTLLEGVRVLDLTRLLPGPHATQLLAQLGAEVIKIEDPDGGDYTRSLSADLFEQVNRGKASITLDLRQADDVAAFKELVRDADVVVEQFRPGVMKRLGCDYDTLKAINPKLVFAALTGYGQTGPLSDDAGHDLNYLSLAGVLDQMGTAGGPPAISNVQIADLAGGALTCTVGILAAVLGAKASGEGAFVDSAMLDGSLALQSVAMGSRASLGQTQPRGEDILTGALPNYRVYKCRDGRYLAIGALEPKFFKRLLTALTPFAGSPGDKKVGSKSSTGASRKSKPKAPPTATAKKMAEWSARLGDAMADPRRARIIMRPVHWGMAAVFRTRPRDAWAELLADADACATPVLTLEEALAHPQAVAREMVQDGALGCPLHFDGAAREPLPASPKLGADNGRVLKRRRAG